MDNQCCPVCGLNSLSRSSDEHEFCENCGNKFKAKFVKDLLAYTELHHNNSGINTKNLKPLAENLNSNSEFCIEVNRFLAEKKIYDINKLDSSANQFYEIGNIEKAKEIFEKITVLEPSDYRGWWGLMKVMPISEQPDDQVGLIISNALKYVKSESRRKEIENYFEYRRILCDEYTKVTDNNRKLTEYHAKTENENKSAISELVNKKRDLENKLQDHVKSFTAPIRASYQIKPFGSKEQRKYRRKYALPERSSPNETGEDLLKTILVIAVAIIFLLPYPYLKTIGIICLVWAAYSLVKTLYRILRYKIVQKNEQQLNKTAEEYLNVFNAKEKEIKDELKNTVQEIERLTKSDPSSPIKEVKITSEKLQEYRFPYKYYLINGLETN